MYTFHTTIHAQPADATAGGRLSLGGREHTTLRIAPQTLGTTPFPLTFEAAVAAISRFEHMYCEPDGSFVWVSPQGHAPWQVDGNLYDRSERLLFVDAKGSCPQREFDRLLSAFGWPETMLMFQLVREAVFLDESEFRRHARRAAEVASKR
jgi:hypothetical protein